MVLLVLEDKNVYVIDGIEIFSVICQKLNFVYINETPNNVHLNC